MLEPLPQEVLKGKIIATKSLVKKQVKEARKVESEIMEAVSEGIDSLSPDQLAKIASSLRDFHICIENALGFIAHNFDDGIPKGEEVNERLLEQMAIQWKDSRPPVLDKVLKEDLKKYLEFRMDFEKDSASIDKARISSLVADLKAVSAAARQQLTDFFDELKKFRGVD